MPKSWNPFDRPFVVRVSPEPDLVVECAAMSMLPNELPMSINDWSLTFDEFDSAFAVIVNLILPPALKKCLKASALAKVAEISEVALEPQPLDEVTVCSAAEIASPDL